MHASNPIIHRSIVEKKSIKEFEDFLFFLREFVILEVFEFRHKYSCYRTSIFRFHFDSFLSRRDDVVSIQEEANDEKEKNNATENNSEKTIEHCNPSYPIDADHDKWETVRIEIIVSICPCLLSFRKNSNKSPRSNPLRNIWFCFDISRKVCFGEKSTHTRNNFTPAPVTYEYLYDEISKNENAIGTQKC